MAFGRSNSLSINTGATNSLFGQQQQNNAASQPPAAGGLFGNSTQQSTSAGSLFGGPAAQQQQQQQQQQTGGGGLFGNNTTQSSQQQSGGLFGNSTAQPQQQSGGLFGNTAAQPQQTSSLFGNTQSNTAQSSGGGLFGNTLNQSTQQQQQPQSTSLFGGAQTNKPAGSLFGTNNNQGTTSGSSLFGGSTLFGGNSQAQQQPGQSSLFGSQSQQQQQQQQPASNSIFGLSAKPAELQTSLLSSSQYRTSQFQPFAGKLSMGQAQSTAGVQQPAQGAVKINFDEMRPTTRYADLIDDIKAQLESIDQMIQKQEQNCRQIEAFLPEHGQKVPSLGPDVDLIKEKAEAVEHALAMDAGGVDMQRRVLESDRKDFQRCERVVMNLAQPLQYRYTGYGGASTSTGLDGDVAKDMDLVSNFFAPVAAELIKTLDLYASNLTEIEGHMRVIEQSAVAQEQQLVSKRAGVGGGAYANGDDTVRELADTLRGFEASILGAAGLVGQCREGVNELVLGRLSNGNGRR
ncbi:hypothetical protein BDY17DRAFT_279796 [Neohortaea acidophila]|uniref:Nucleoporin NUP49/NSP49 n=1 Tax=Neohortaea acidophila TaxID=245834 RepID=A0A6A6PSR1_9PEZI|nr:uncharacterized protein BDY17DRAFT_279796 [Neohortaea acidophila]KAF2483012.1 hypothetical protein BDY17DRAFT_279796 [Neohortaea acidophila]